jgi:hypothetical protein
MPAADGPPTADALRAAVTDARSLTAHEAANLLCISPATLRAWEHEFGFPASVRSEHPAPNYRVTDLLALQDALSNALSITSAINTARQRIPHPF